MTDIFNEQQRDAREFFGTGEFAEDADTIREEREAAADNAEEIEADTIQVYLDNGYSLMEATAAAKGGNEWSTGDNTSTTVTSGDNRRTAEESQRKSSRNKNWINVSNLRTKNRKKPEEKIGGTLRYPYEALTDQTDYLQFDIKQYVPLGLKSLVRAPGDDKRYVKGGNDAAGGILPQELTTTTRAVINDGTILLPIPAQIQDSNSVSYGDSSLNGLQAAGVSAAAGMQQGIADAINKGSVKEAWDEFSGKIGNTAMEFGKNSLEGIGGEQVAADMLLKYFSAQAVSAFGGNVTFSQLLTRSSGEILNPNMELLFNGPTLRSFRFSFKMTPRNPMEANQCGLIIRAFKRNMAAKAQGTSQSGSWFLKTPNVFMLRYRSGNKDHPFLHKFKQCFLTDCSVNYTADGVYATYEDATPTSMILDLSFKEVEPIYNIDYDQQPGQEAVGY